MKPGKAAVPDDIAMELIQNASTELQDELFKLVNDIHYRRDLKRLQGL